MPDATHQCARLALLTDLSSQVDIDWELLNTVMLGEDDDAVEDEMVEHRVGDRVEAELDGRWYAGVLMQVGEGLQFADGSYRVHLDVHGLDSDIDLRTDSVRVTDSMLCDRADEVALDWVDLVGEDADWQKVEQLCGQRGEGNDREFKVTWSGDFADSWEPEANIDPVLVVEWLRKQQGTADCEMRYNLQELRSQEAELDAIGLEAQQLLDGLWSEAVVAAELPTPLVDEWSESVLAAELPARVGDEPELEGQLGMDADDSRGRKRLGQEGQEAGKLRRATAADTGSSRRRSRKRAGFARDLEEQVRDGDLVQKVVGMRAELGIDLETTYRIVWTDRHTDSWVKNSLLDKTVSCKKHLADFWDEARKEGPWSKIRRLEDSFSSGEDDVVMLGEVVADSEQEQEQQQADEDMGEDRERIGTWFPERGDG